MNLLLQPDPNALPKDRQFDSLGDLLDYVEVLPGEPNYSDTGWRGLGASWDDCIKMARYGWPEGIAKASELSRIIADRVVESVGNVMNQELQYDVAGGAYDVGGYLSGVPECWIRPEQQIAKREVRLMINVNASYGVPASALMKRGIAVAALAMALQAQGYPVTIDCGLEVGKAYTSWDNNSETVYTRIQDANNPLFDIDSLVFAMAHPGFLRYFMFAVTDGYKEGDLRRLNGGRVDDGHPPEALANPSIYIGSAHLDQVNRWKDNGAEWVLGEYERQTAG